MQPFKTDSKIEGRERVLDMGHFIGTGKYQDSEFDPAWEILCGGIYNPLFSLPSPGSVIVNATAVFKHNTTVPSTSDMVRALYSKLMHTGMMLGDFSLNGDSIQSTGKSWDIFSKVGDTMHWLLLPAGQMVYCQKAYCPAATAANQTRRRCVGSILHNVI